MFRGNAVMGILDDKLLFPINWPQQPADCPLSPAEDDLATDVTPIDWPLAPAKDDVAAGVTLVDWPLSLAGDVIAADVTPADWPLSPVRASR